MRLTIILLVICLFILYDTREPQEFVDVKERYQILREHLHETDNQKFHTIRRHIPITGIKNMNGTVGYNLNKGSEITVCLDGTPNEIFHVLIHELAHSTVDEYSHTPEFWDNYTELRDICVELGIYEKIPERTPFCGEHVQDK